MTCLRCQNPDSAYLSRLTGYCSSCTAQVEAIRAESHAAYVQTIHNRFVANKGPTQHTQLPTTPSQSLKSRPIT